MHERKLLYVINSLEIGGTERHLIQIIINLKLKGWEPEIFVFAAGGPLISYLHKYNIPVHEFFMPKWLDYLAEKKEYLFLKV